MAKDDSPVLSFIGQAPGIQIEEAAEVSPVNQNVNRWRNKKWVDDPVDYYWEASAKPFKIVKSLAQKGGQKLLLLLVIELDVLLQDNHVQDCSEVNFYGPYTYVQAFICSFTKAFVRLFPILAIFFTIIITMKQMHFKRVFYQTLKRGGLLVYEHFNFHHDPDYLLMIFFYFMAMLHFVQMFFQIFYYHVFIDIHDKASATGVFANLTNTSNPDPDVETAKSVLPFYILPGFIWWGLFVAAYDNAKLTLPMMKFFAEHPYQMQAYIGNCRIMKEHIAAYVLRKRVALDKAVDTQTLFDAWISETHKITQQWHELVAAKKFEAADALTDGGPSEILSRRRMLDTWWPSRILFAERLDDFDSLDYRLYFDLVTVVCMLMFVTVFGFLCYLFYDAYLEMFNAHHSHSWTNFVIYLLFTLWAAQAMYKLVLKTRMLLVCFEDMHYIDDFCNLRFFNDAKDRTEVEPLIAASQMEEQSSGEDKPLKNPKQNDRTCPLASC